MPDETTRWQVWRDGIQHEELEPWAAEATIDHFNPAGVTRQWFATWREAYDYALSEARAADVLALSDVTRGSTTVAAWAEDRLRLDNGEAFRLKRQEALSGASDDLVYVEFSADRDADLDDRATLERHRDAGTAGLWHMGCAACGRERPCPDARAVIDYWTEDA